MKRVFKITIIFITLMISFNSLNIVYGAPTTMTQQTDSGGSGAVRDIRPSEWKPAEEESTKMKEKVSIVLGIIKAIGIILSVGALIVIGIKEMTASVEEKSRMKEAMPAYILGVFLIAGMAIIPSMVYDFMKNI